MEIPGLDCEILLTRATGWDRAALIAHPERPVGEEASERYLQGIERRSRREPLAHITGVQEFYGYAFAVSSSVLIPRPETEILVEQALAAFHAQSLRRVLDIGTGSGCIPIAFALECQKHGKVPAIDAVDISTDALNAAIANAAALGAAALIRFVRVDATDAAEALPDGDYDLVLSNPPYIPSADIDGLMPEVRNYEPRDALDGGPDGLEVVRAVLDRCRGCLSKRGRLLMEIGVGQAEQVTEEAREREQRVVEIHADLAGIPRIVEIARAD